MTTYDSKRLIGAIAMFFVALALTNSFFEFVLPRFADGTGTVVVLVVLVNITRLASTQAEFEEHRRKRDERHQVP